MIQIQSLEMDYGLKKGHDVVTKESRDRGSNAFFTLADTGHDIDGESDVEDKYALDEMGRCEESSGAATESVIELCHGKSKFVSISEHLPSRRQCNWLLVVTSASQFAIQFLFQSTVLSELRDIFLLLQGAHCDTRVGEICGST